MKRTLFAIESILFALVLCACAAASDGAATFDGAAASNGAAPQEGQELVFSHQGGCYAEPFALEITAPQGCAVYYTTDGSNPVSSATCMEYTEPIPITSGSGRENVVSAVPPELIDTAHCHVDTKTKRLVPYTRAPKDSEVDKCTIVRAVCVREDGTVSEAVGHTYFIGTMAEHIRGIEKSCKAAGTTLAVISISMDFDDLFDEESGIYVRGPAFQEALERYLDAGGSPKDDCARKMPANYFMRGREWEKEAYIDFYECDSGSATRVLSQSCGIRIQGNYSRSDWQKSFRLYARKEYGKKRFEYAVFGEGKKDDGGNVLDSFKTLVLRNGGNCAFTAKFNDSYWQAMVRDMACETLAARPAVVYLNGEYWGLYVLEEDYTEEYFVDTHNVDSENVVMYKGNAEVYAKGYKLELGGLPFGETDESYYYGALVDFFAEHKDLADEGDYEEFCRLVDPDSCRDYFAVQCWINNKWDWPGKNWAMWKTIAQEDENPYADGRWRFCFFDVDFGGVTGWGEASANTIKEDNDMSYGLLDKRTKNLAVRCFAYLMTNEGFREGFYRTLESLTDERFAYPNANEVLTRFEEIYTPLYRQFFERYPGGGSEAEALNGGYASVKCVRDFLKERSAHIQKMIDYCEKHYKKQKR